MEEEKSDLKVGAEESEEAWKQTLASFKEEALKMQCVSQEAYELYSKKAIVILKETSKQLKIQAEKAREDLSVIAKQISEEGKEYLSTAAEKSPEPVKDIVDTLATYGSSVNEDTKFSEVHDFFLGIPYGMYCVEQLSLNITVSKTRNPKLSFSGFVSVVYASATIPLLVVISKIQNRT